MAVFTDPRPARERERKQYQDDAKWEAKLGTILQVGGGILGGVAGGVAGGPAGAMAGAQAGMGLGGLAAGLMGDTHVAGQQLAQAPGVMMQGAKFGMLGDGKQPGAWTKAWRDHQMGQQMQGSLGKASHYNPQLWGVGPGSYKNPWQSRPDPAEAYKMRSPWKNTLGGGPRRTPGMTFGQQRTPGMSLGNY